MSQTEVQLIKDAVIVNADVSNSAAIDVSKLSGVMPSAGGTFSGAVTVTGDVDSTTGIFERTTGFTSQLKFTDSNETKLVHGSNGQVKLSFVGVGNAARGSIDGQSGFIRMITATGDTGVICRDNSSTDLRFNDSTKLETTNTGIAVTGNITTTGDADINGGDLTITGGEGISAVLKLVADQGDDNGDGWKIQSEQDENDLTFKSNISGSYVDKLKLKNSGQLEVQGNLAVSGTITPTGNIVIPDTIVHDGDSNTKIRFPAADSISMESAGSEVFRITPDEAHGSSQSIRLKSANTVDGASVQTGGTKAYSSGIPRGQVNIMDYQAYNVTDNGGAIAFGARYNSSDAHTTMASIEGVKHNNDDGNYQGAIAFKTRNNNGDNIIRMRLTDNGLCFGTDTAGANALNDYEEGTWTPNFDDAYITSPGTTYNSRAGKYIKIGKMVLARFHVNFAGVGNSGAGPFIGTHGLPFTPDTSDISGRGMQGSLYISGPNTPADTVNVNFGYAKLDNGNYYLGLSTPQDDLGSTNARNIQAADITNGDVISGTVMYIAS